MKLLFLLVVVPFAILAQDVIEDVVIEPIPIEAKRPPRPPTGVTIPPKPRILPKKPFVVVTNGIIRRNLPFNVAVRRFGSTSRKVSLTIILAGTSESGVPFSAKKYATVKRGSTSAWVTFDSSKIPKGSYSLKVEGEGFEEKVSLVYAQKESSLLVQLEKAIYSPGQTVQFRVFAIDSLTNAVSPGDKCSVSIKDSNGNLIVEYEKPQFVKGKYENKLVLGDKAPEGIWSFEVICGRESAYEPFEVAEYKLPAFSATLTVPSQTPFSNGDVPFQITAVYSFGDPVDGNATLEINRWGDKILTREITITNGEASFELKPESELNATPDGWWYYEYTLVVTDSILNSKASVEGSFQVVPFKYNIQLTGSPYLTPGSSYPYSVLVSAEDGSFPPAGTIVTITVYPQNTNLQLTLNSVGSASSSIAVPKDTTYLSISASAKESNQGSLYAYFQQGSPGSIALFPNYRNGEGATLNKWFEIKAIVSDKVDWIVYYVASKGVLLDTQRVSFKSKSNSVKIWIKPDIRYFPRFTVIAAYLKGADIIVNEVTINARDKLNNYVKLNFDDVEVKPGTNYSFTVESRCDSTVSLSAIDTRVLQYRSGNEVLYDDVLNAVNSYEWSEWLPWEDSYTPPYKWPFRNAKLNILTNIPPPPPPEYFYDEQARPQPQPNEKEGSRRPDPKQDVKVRKDFSETFCWTDVDTKNDNSCSSSSEENNHACRAKVNCKVPDSITKYLFYSVSMNTKYGIGVTDIPSNITVKLPFFMVWDPPYSVKRNEILVLDIAFFNSINRNQSIVITITKTDRYEGLDLATYGWTETATGYEKTVAAVANTNFKVQFGLKFLFMGIFNIKIVAKGPLAGDGIEKPVRVIPEGIPRTSTRSVMIVGNSPADTNLECVYPDGVYEDTKTILSTIVGDLLGKALNNIDNLIQMPSGCGEQNLLFLVPDIAIHKYLKATGKLTPALDNKLKEFEAAGIQNQLSYLRSDGSFSAFGNNDESGSVWLTIYTAFAFDMAREFVTVDDNVIRNAINFVVGYQQANGSFTEPGRVIHVDMQGGSSNGLGMTAYISLALTRMLPNYPEFTTARDNANTYLKSVLPSTTDVYELAIIAHALLIAEDAEGTNAFNSFYALRTESATEIFWAKTLNPPNFWYSSLSLDIETSSHGLVNLVKIGDTANGIKVAKYLAGQANNLGGYSSSQDTVMALLSLAEFSTSFSFGAVVDLTLTPDVGDPFNARVDSTNAMTLQQFELDNTLSILNVKPSPSSTGLAIVSLTCNYYQDPSFVVPVFDITHEFYRQCKWSIGLRVCASHIPKGNSNMAIITVALPSGFQYQEWWGGPNNPDVTKVETLNSGSKVVFYFNTIRNKPSCVDVNAYRAQTVTELKGGTIIVNDYYDTSKEGSAKYPAPDLGGSCWY